MKRYIVTEEQLKYLEDAAMRYALEDLELSERGKNDRYELAEYTVGDAHTSCRAIQIPDWATHFTTERPDENGEPFWSRQEIPK